jgi:hypothetical protein
MAIVHSTEDQAAGTGDFKRELLDEGVYDMKLVKIIGIMRDGTSEYPDPKPSLLCIWAWCEPTGALYENEEGKNYEVIEFLGMPTGMPNRLKYHEKTGYYKRLSEIAGVPIANQEDVKKIGHDFGDFISTWEDVLEVISHPDAEKPDKKGKVYVEQLHVSGVEQLGRVCRVVVKKVSGKKDPTKFYNNISAVMQLETAGPKRPPTAKKAAAPTQDTAPTTSAPRPAARPPVEIDMQEAELPY